MEPSDSTQWCAMSEQMYLLLTFSRTEENSSTSYRGKPTTCVSWQVTDAHSHCRFFAEGEKWKGFSENAILSEDGVISLPGNIILAERNNRDGKETQLAGI